MRAARIHEYGPPEVLRVEATDVPRIRARDLLVQVHAAAINPVDWKIRSGYQRAVVRYDLPHTLGLDASGVVTEIGPKVTRFSVGDEVYFSPTHRRQGTYAEFVAVAEKEVARKPKNLSHEEAAGIPLAGLTAWKCLVTAARISAGQRVLVHAGAGGVGTLAIQIAKHFGCEVATTCSQKNADLVRSLGADVVIDHNREAYDELLRDYDVVLDALGGEHKPRSARVLKKGGVVTSIVNDIPTLVNRHGAYLGFALAVGGILRHKVWFWRRGLRYAQVLKDADGDALGKMTEIIEAGGMRAVVDRVFPLDDIVEAHRYSETARARGKIIIAIP